MPTFLKRTSIFVLGALATLLCHGADIWDAPAFSVSPEALRAAAAEIKAQKGFDITILLQEELITFDVQGRETHTWHLIFRVETEAGAEESAQIRGGWEPWRQDRPQIDARVITTEGSVHQLDQKTLNDVPLHQGEIELYTDKRAFGGPLPAMGAGAIVEETIVTRDNAPFFSAGTTQRALLVRSVPVHQARLVFSYPKSLTFQYLVELLPNSSEKKTMEHDIQKVVIETGPLPPFNEDVSFVPPDVPLHGQVEYTTGISWKSVAAEYARLTQEKFRTSDVQSMVVDAHISGLSREQTITKLVSALHKAVRYTGVEFGESGLVPQFPAETLKRKYGDCKDKATLLVAMLRAAGVPADLALLATGPGRDINPKLPGLGMFDHAIVHVPASGKTGELWIDATSEYSQVGYLPRADYGRWALIVNSATEGLSKTPELTAELDLHREIRTFTLPEFGPARIAETNDGTGPIDAEYRFHYSGDVKELKKSSEAYVKRVYSADSLLSLDKSDPRDLEKPFSVTYIANGRRGFTNSQKAEVHIPYGSIFDQLPGYFFHEKSSEKENLDDDDGPGTGARHADWQLDPFITEWHYVITAPPGYKLRTLPARLEKDFGPAHFSQKYTSFNDGSLDAIFRFELKKGRLGLDEAMSLRDAVVAARESDSITVVFDNAASLYFHAGKVREALAAYQDLVNLHPKEALHRSELAEALVKAGLAEKARLVAREATVLEPTSARAFNSLGWVLERDLIGRPFKSGFDYSGALAALRKAKELDPKDKDVRINLAMLLEYSPTGERYSAHSPLKESITEFRDLKKLDEQTGKSYDENVLYDLWYDRDLSSLSEMLRSQPDNENRRKFVVAVSAMEEGPVAAIKKSNETNSNENNHARTLTNAAWLLVRIHEYGKASDLFEAGAAGQDNGAQIVALAAKLKRSVPRDQFHFDPGPRGVVERMYSLMQTESPKYQSLLELLGKHALHSNDPERAPVEFRAQLARWRQQALRAGLQPDTQGDIMLGNSRYTVEGDDALGYKVTLELPGAAPQPIFVAKENGSYKILEFGLAGPKVPGALGWRALDLLDKNDLTRAGKILDWARDQVHMTANDDPLMVNPFPYFWTKGQEADATKVRTAALVLVPPKTLKGEELNELLKARDAAVTPEEKMRLDLVAAQAYFTQKRWEELETVALRLKNAAPDSPTAFTFLERSFAGLGKLDEWSRLVQQSMSKYPDEATYSRSAAELSRTKGDFAGGRAILKRLIEQSKANNEDLNLYAWDALFGTADISDDAIDASVRADLLTKSSNFDIMHTLACIYARSGKPMLARDVLLKAMDAAGLEAPDSAVWLAYGMISEQLRELDAAQAMYARVEKPTSDSPGSNYQLAQQRVLALKSMGSKATATAAK